MKTRPLGLIILTILIFFEPLAKLFLYSEVYQVSMKGLLTYYWHSFNFFYFSSLFLLYPITAIFLYKVRKWNYYLILVSIIVSIVFNLLHLLEVYGQGNFLLNATIIGGLVGNLFLIAYIFFPSTFQMYHNAGIRWWEAKPRYQIESEGKVESLDGKLQEKAKILDISESGAFVTKVENLKDGEIIYLAFEYKNNLFRFRGKVKNPPSEKKDIGFGLSFVELTKIQKTQLKMLMNCLERSGLRVQAKKKDYIQESLIKVKNRLNI